jgi:hypothetical protein
MQEEFEDNTSPLLSLNSSYLHLCYLQTLLAYTFGIFKRFIPTPLVSSNSSYLHLWYLQAFEDTKGVGKKSLKIPKG